MENNFTCQVRAILSLSLFSVCACAAGDDRERSRTLVFDGKPMAMITVAPDAPDTVRDAVRDLQAYIEKMSGARLPIEHSGQGPEYRILVGRMPAVEQCVADLDTYDLGHDGIVVKSFPNRLVLTGQSDGSSSRWTGQTDCGTPNAVYYFLETLGCRWYMPGEDGEVVPRKTTIEVPALDVVSKPDFLSRCIGGWAAARVNEKVSEDFQVWTKRNRLGKNRYHEGHSLLGLLNPKEYFESHPEYFSLIDGERQSGYAQACTANPQVVRVVSQNLHNMVKDRPKQGWRSYPVGQNDNSRWCQCERCTVLDGDKMFTYGQIEGARVIGTGSGTYRNIANRYLIFVNEVAQGYERLYPDGLVSYYAYYCLPGFPQVKPRDNVLPVMTHFWDSDASRKMITLWAGISRHLYYYGYVGYKISLPKFGIVDDIRWCHGQKGIGMTFAEDEHSPLNMVTCYLIARAMWDVHTDTNEVLEEFYEKYYGAAGKPMRMFYETFDAATREMTREWDIHAHYPESLTSKVVARCRSYLTQAMGKAPDPVGKRRITSMSKYWRVVELHVTAQNAMARWREATTTAHNKAARTACRDLMNYVRSVSDVFHCPQRIYLAEEWLRDLEKEPEGIQ